HAFTKFLVVHVSCLAFFGSSSSPQGHVAERQDSENALDARLKHLSLSETHRLAACSGETISTHRSEPMAKGKLSKLAERLVSAYYRASWPDVEDDVNLCVWVGKQSGMELTVKQVGKLRTAMEALIAKSPKVVIFVEGGVVQGCTSNDKSLLVTV